MKPLESYILSKEHAMLYPNLERNVFLVLGLVISIATVVAVYLCK